MHWWPWQGHDNVDRDESVTDFRSGWITKTILGIRQTNREGKRPFITTHMQKDIVGSLNEVSLQNQGEILWKF